MAEAVREVKEEGEVMQEEGRWSRKRRKEVLESGLIVLLEHPI